MRMSVPVSWAVRSDPDWHAGCCVVCGRKTAKRGKRYVIFDIEDQCVLDSEGTQFLPVGSECVKQIPTRFVL
jgi:hypothetical protein